MKRALAVVGSALVAACTYVLMWSGASWAHTPAMTETCSGVTLSAESYPVGTAMRLDVDGVTTTRTLTAPSYVNAPAVLAAVLPGTGSTVRGWITSSDHEKDFDSGPVEVQPCPSTSPSSPMPSPSSTSSTTAIATPFASHSVPPKSSTTPSPSASHSPDPSPTSAMATPSPTPTRSSAVPSSTPVLPSATPSSPGPQLPRTGPRDVLAVLLFALILIAGGSAALWVSLRKPSDREVQR